MIGSNPARMRLDTIGGFRASFGASLRADEFKASTNRWRLPICAAASPSIRWREWLAIQLVRDERGGHRLTTRGKRIHVRARRVAHVFSINGERHCTVANLYDNLRAVGIP